MPSLARRYLCDFPLLTMLSYISRKTIFMKRNGASAASIPTSFSSRRWECKYARNLFVAFVAICLSQSLIALVLSWFSDTASILSLVVKELIVCAHLALFLI